MRARLNPLDKAILVLIVVVAVVYAALFSGVVRSQDALSPATPVDLQSLPEGNAPSGPRQPSAWERAEADDSPDLPGRYVPSQGVQHTPDVWPLDEDQRVPYCQEGEVRDDCYASLPPTSGLHMPSQRAAELAPGLVVSLPPASGIYEFDLPREAVPHVLEHAGVFVGHHCESDACRTRVRALEALVAEELSLGARVVMTRFSDLPPDTIALASWTRVDAFPASEFDPVRVSAFIKTHSCRFDREGFCREDTPRS